MAEIHTATNGPLVTELVADVVAAIREIEDYAANQAATLCYDHGNNRKVADAAIYEVWTELQDHLQIKLATTLAAHGVSA